MSMSLSDRCALKQVQLRSRFEAMPRCNSIDVSVLFAKPCSAYLLSRLSAPSAHWRCAVCGESFTTKGEVDSSSSERRSRGVAVCEAQRRLIKVADRYAVAWGLGGQPIAFTTGSFGCRHMPLPKSSELDR